MHVNGSNGLWVGFKKFTHQPAAGKLILPVGEWKLVEIMY
jgi:hypothetical protein